MRSVIKYVKLDNTRPRGYHPGRPGEPLENHTNRPDFGKTTGWTAKRLLCVHCVWQHSVVEFSNKTRSFVWSHSYVNGVPWDPVDFQWRHNGRRGPRRRRRRRHNSETEWNVLRETPQRKITKLSFVAKTLTKRQCVVFIEHGVIVYVYTESHTNAFETITVRTVDNQGVFRAFRTMGTRRPK